MLTAHNIGHVALSASFCFYCIYFLPQIWHNAKAANAQSLSRFLHLLFVFGAACDWVYGAGHHLPWQYRLVTFIFLSLLLVQHIQIRPDGKYPLKDKRYLITSAVVLLTYAAAFLLATVAAHYPTSTLNAFGFISSTCWMAAFIPQLVKNYRRRSGLGISHLFIAITFVTAGLDFIAAVYLRWPLPSLVAPPILAALHALCWLQQRYYRSKARSPSNNSFISS